MKKWKVLLLLVMIIYIVPSCIALECYVCKTSKNSECHDLRDTYIKAQDCTGNLKWGEKFACIVNSSMVNNLIETDRNCIIINSLSEPCSGKTSPNKFGTCRICFEDGCNNENNLTSSMHNCWNMSLIFMAYLALLV